MAILFGKLEHLGNFGRRPFNEHLCEIILNLDLQRVRRCCLKDILSIALAAILFDGTDPFTSRKFGRGHNEEHCEIILNLDQWFRRCC